MYRGSLKGGEGIWCPHGLEASSLQIRIVMGCIALTRSWRAWFHGGTTRYITGEALLNSIFMRMTNITQCHLWCAKIMHTWTNHWSTWPLGCWKKWSWVFQQSSQLTCIYICMRWTGDGKHVSVWVQEVNGDSKRELY